MLLFFHSQILTLTADRADLNALVVCKAFVNRPEVGADESSAVYANPTIQVVWNPIQESFEETTENGLATTKIVYSGNPTPNVSVDEEENKAGYTGQDGAPGVVNS